MTEGIGKIGGSNGYMLNGYIQRKKGNEEEGKLGEKQESSIGNRKDINPDEIFNMMGEMAINLKPQVKKVLKEGELPELSPEVQARIEDSMKEFEAIYGIVEKEVGRTLAPDVMELLALRK